MLSGKSWCHIALLGAVIDVCHSKTVNVLDVVYGLKHSGRTLYGFGALGTLVHVAHAHAYTLDTHTHAGRLVHTLNAHPRRHAPDAHAHIGCLAHPRCVRAHRMPRAPSTNTNVHAEQLPA
jgi:hypothetical protein